MCLGSSFPSNINIGGLFPTESHEYEVFRFALSHHQDIPKLVPQVDMVKMGNSFSMTYACKSFLFPTVSVILIPPILPSNFLVCFICYLCIRSICCCPSAQRDHWPTLVLNYFPTI
ncbi:unnamed protein product [Oncorhynchus mykiss]|uniref:Uncharacterized protein n=1 Tax=Oncorhynchus mykiss TaxID=8022 RepID=A0A060YN85_ONCMY|nr:unnamed protein product [Oncorhynchus mykiss]